MNIKYINKKVKPGTDFFKFATGNWIEHHPQPDDKPSWGSFDVLSETVQQQLYDMIKSNYESYHPSMTAEQKRMVEFFWLMTDYERRNKEDISVLKPYIEKLNSLNSVNDILKFCISDMGSQFFISVGVSPDMKNSTRNEVEITQNLILGNKEYYTGTDKSVINKYKSVTKKVLQRAGYSLSDAQNMIDVFFKYEQMIAEVAYDAETLEHPEENYHMMSVEELTKLTNVPIKTFLSWHGMNSTSKLNVAQVSPIIRAFDILNNLSVDELKTIVEFVIVTDNVGRTSEDFGEISFEFTQFINGAKKRTDKWKRETNKMNNVFGEILGKMYVEKYFPESSKIKMLILVDNLKKAFSQIISEQSWMSEETKNVALDKLDSMTCKIGYPDKWKDYSDIPVDTQKSYLDNCLAIHKYFHDRMLKEEYNKEVDRDEWYMNPQTVNAYYNPCNNEICFPAGILQGDFFDPYMDDAVNYGGIGVVIGHEMTHGFDTCGRLFDKNGNMTDWWSEKDAEEFNKLTENIRNHFNGLKVLADLNANGDLTLNENIADGGGLKIALRALENACKTSMIIQGYNYKQRFFLSYACVWAGVETEEIIKHNTLNNCHSLHFMRVNGSLPLIDSWYDAFGITEKDKLFVEKDKRNRLW